MSIRQLMVLMTFVAICATVVLYVQRTMVAGDFTSRQQLPFWGLWGTFASPFLALLFARIWVSSAKQDSGSGYVLWIFIGLVTSCYWFFVFTKTAHLAI